MIYSTNDLWSVRQIEFLGGALEGYENSKVDYYPDKAFTVDIPGIETYQFVGVLRFEGRDRTIIFEQGEGFGLKQAETLENLKKLNIEPSLK